MTMQPQYDEADHQLAILDQESNTLTAPEAAIETIVGHLDALYAAGAPGNVLDTIQASAVEMAETVNQHFAALPLALPDPRGELQRLVDHLSLEVLPAAGLFRWTDEGPDFTDQVHLGSRGQHFTISINRGARYRGGVCHSEGVTVTAPDGSIRRFGLLISKEALLKLLALLRQRHHAAERDRLRGLVALAEQQAARVAELEHVLGNGRPRNRMSVLQ